CLGPRCSTYYIVCFLLLVRSARKILFCSIAVCSTVAWLRTSNGGIRVFARIGSLRMIQNEPASKQEDIDLVALDAALTRLAEVDPEQSKLVELRYFAGPTIEDAAHVNVAGDRKEQDGLPPRRGYAARFPALTYNDRFRSAQIAFHLCQNCRAGSR